jgi:hypothetical protein
MRFGERHVIGNTQMSNSARPRISASSRQFSGKVGDSMPDIAPRLTRSMGSQQVKKYYSKSHFILPLLADINGM